MIYSSFLFQQFEESELFEECSNSDDVPPPKQVRREGVSSSKNKENDVLDQAIKTLLEINNNNVGSKFRGFGDSVVEQLSDLPAEDAYDAMAEIQQILTAKKKCSKQGCSH